MSAAPNPTSDLGSSRGGFGGHCLIVGQTDPPLEGGAGLAGVQQRSWYWKPGVQAPGCTPLPGTPSRVAPGAPVLHRGTTSQDPGKVGSCLTLRSTGFCTSEHPAPVLQGLL